MRRLFLIDFMLQMPAADIVRGRCRVPVALQWLQLLTHSETTAHASKCFVSVTLEWLQPWSQTVTAAHAAAVLNCSGYIGVASNCCMLVLCS